MNFDKKRRARVQGGWATAPISNKGGFKLGSPSVSKPTQNDESNMNIQGKQRSSDYLSRQVLSQAKSNKGKPPMPVGPIWMAKNVDTPSPRSTFVFEDPEEVK